MADAVAIGSLRWRVAVCSRPQAQSGTTGIAETLVTIATVWADVQPIGALTFWSAQQTDTPVTHRIRMRWLDYLDNTHVITRASTRPDGSTRTEVFRVRRIKELGGRKRFVEIEAELETAS